MIDLRSDTVTLPTPEMKKAMMNAPLGDDVLGEDPSIITLEKKTAAIFGMEAGLYCPSGTMSNQLAIAVHVKPGDEVILSRESHLYNYEGGGICRLAGASVRTIEGNSGIINAEQVRQNINPTNDVHFPLSRLVCLENTVNRGGGDTYNLKDIAAIRTVCDQHGLGLHLDGARVFNAIVANNEDPKEYGQLFHSISICMSKGLGAPVGSVLISSKDFIERAKRVRKVYGGGMRQAGIIAAACTYALDHHVNRMVEDHQRAKVIAEALGKCSFVKEMLPVKTNIVIAVLEDGLENDVVIANLKSQGILAGGMGPGRIRFVTHLDISDEDIIKTVKGLKKMENTLFIKATP